jgi:hypothetical protein
MVAALVAGCGTFDFLEKDDGFVKGVGRLPGGDFDTLVSLPEGIDISFPDLNGGVIGPQVRGPRVLMIGDSILSSTSSRYGNEMCDVMVPLGWQIEIEAEASRFIEFGSKVLDSRLTAGWDSALVFLGTNFAGNLEDYEYKLRSIFDRLSPMPFVVVTTSLFRDAQKDVNTVITALAQQYDNVTVLDWAQISKNPGVLSDDRVHLSKLGRTVFAAAVARSFGFAPPGTGACLPSVFRNDSSAAPGVMPGTTIAEVITETTIAVATPGAVTSVPAAASTTVPPAAPTTVLTTAVPTTAPTAATTTVPKAAKTTLP